VAHPLIEAPPVEERRIPMTYDEWLAWSGEGTRSEWVDGEAIVFMPTKEPHAGASWFLATLLGLYAQGLGLGRVFASELEMRLRPGRSSRQPDVLFIAKANLGRLTVDRLEGPADLVVELISDDSVTRDRVVKFREYAAAGIPEYWIFDPRPGKQTSDFFRLDVRGDYQAVPLDADGRYRSQVLPGFWLDPTWLWQVPEPDVLTLLASIAADVFRPPLARPG